MRREDESPGKRQQPDSRHESCLWSPKEPGMACRCCFPVVWAFVSIDFKMQSKTARDSLALPYVMMGDEMEMAEVD